LHSSAYRSETDTDRRLAGNKDVSTANQTMNDVSLKTRKVGEGAAARDIAARIRAGRAPGLFWLGGFKSDMKGTKAEALDNWAAAQGRACTRFDYS
jgi:hypothetical protein